MKKSVKNYSKTILIVGIVIIFFLIILGVLMMMGNKESKYSNDKAIKNDENVAVDNPVFEEKPVIVYKPITEVKTSTGDKTIYGKWNVINEIMNGETYSNYSDSSITFNQDGTYVKRIEGNDMTGRFTIINNVILFYNSEEELKAYKNNMGRFNDANYEINGNSLKLSYITNPTEVVLERAN